MEKDIVLDEDGYPVGRLKGRELLAVLRTIRSDVPVQVIAIYDRVLSPGESNAVRRKASEETGVSVTFI